MFGEGVLYRKMATTLGVSHGTIKQDIQWLRKRDQIDRRQGPLVDSYVSEDQADEIQRMWRDQLLPIREIADHYGWTRIQAWNVITHLRKKGYDLPGRKGDLEVEPAERTKIKRGVKKRRLNDVAVVGISEKSKTVIRICAAAQRPLSAVEVHRFLNLLGERISKQGARNRLGLAERDGFLARAKPGTRRWYERGAGRWFIPLDREQPAQNLTLADAERETELAALIESQGDELKRGDWVDSEKGHWADKSIDAPLTADGFTILDTLGDEDEALAELVGEAA
jgi:biotin operon repressor